MERWGVFQKTYLMMKIVSKKSARTIVALSLFSVIVSSCAKPCYQMYKADYVSNPVNQDISVSYDLWSENGRMAFLLKNNTGKILTIHTDKCFFILNGMSNCHFNGEITSQTSGKSISFSPFNEVSVGFSSSKSNAIIQQRTLNIAPKGSHAFNSFEINEAHIMDERIRVKPFRKEIKTATYTQDDSPIKFTNVITYSIAGDGKEYTTETEFYVKEVSNIHRKMFLVAVKKWPVDSKVYKCPHASAMGFYTQYLR